MSWLTDDRVLFAGAHRGHGGLFRLDTSTGEVDTLIEREELTTGLSIDAERHRVPEGIRAAVDEVVDGWLWTPERLPPGPCPLVLSVHGGPEAFTGPRFDVDLQALTAAGLLRRRREPARLDQLRTAMGRAGVRGLGPGAEWASWAAATAVTWPRTQSPRRGGSAPPSRWR